MLYAEISSVTEIVASVSAAFAILFGVGATVRESYMKGKSILPNVMVRWVIIPSIIALSFRVITFLINSNYWFFIAVDSTGILVMTCVVFQHHGKLLRKAHKSAQ